MNKAMLVGRLTANPNYDTAATGTSYARFTLAISRPTSEPQTDFIPCVAFRKTADLVNQYLSKGSLIAIEGRINSSNYTNKDGKNVTRIEVLVDRLNFLESKNSRNNSNNYNNSSSSNNISNHNNQSNNDSQNNSNDFDDLEFVFE